MLASEMLALPLLIVICPLAAASPDTLAATTAPAELLAPEKVTLPELVNVNRAGRVETSAAFVPTFIAGALLHEAAPPDTYVSTCPADGDGELLEPITMLVDPNPSAAPLVRRTNAKAFVDAKLTALVINSLKP
jgi:hypothetical protein